MLSKTAFLIFAFGIFVEAFGQSNQNSLKRRARLVIFVQRSLADRWISQKNRPEYEITSTLTGSFAKQMSQLFSSQMFGNGVDIKFDIQAKINTPADDNALNNLKYKFSSKGSRAGVNAFCQWQNQKNNGGNQWGTAIYVYDRNTGFSTDSTGMAFEIGDACYLGNNCAVVEGQVNNWQNDVVFDKLLAHEFGHLLGFVHPTTGNCQSGIMWSPGNQGQWDYCTKQKAYEVFSNAWAHNCMPYQYGVMPPPTVQPGRISKEDENVLAQNCPGEIRTHEGYRKFYYTTPTYKQYLQTTPNWWYMNNVCVWIPCMVPYNSDVTFDAVTNLQGKPCGVNKICQNQQCVYGNGGNTGGNNGGNTGTNTGGITGTGGGSAVSGCGGPKILTAYSGTFSSLNYDGQTPYGFNQNCEWIIRAPQGYVIDLYFSRFDVQSNGNNCGQWGDYVNIYNGDSANAGLYASYCNNQQGSVRGWNGALCVKFVSDANYPVGTGFVAQYKIFSPQGK